MNTLNRKAFGGLLIVLLVLAALLFIPAWTLDYWQAWAFLVIHSTSSLAITLYLMKKDRKLLERRMNGGPTAEKEPVQKLVMFFVFKQNTFTSAIIELAPDQTVISTGPYALVRHPMYAGGLVMLLGIPIALGSWWGLLVIAAMTPALIWRLFDEEKFLARNLPGYGEYQKKVRYRLIPQVW